jgi:hypothetical protein
VQPIYSRVIERSRNRDRLILGCHWRLPGAVSEIVDRKYAEFPRVDRTIGADDVLPPAVARILWRSGDVFRCRDPAKHNDHRR